MEYFVRFLIGGAIVTAFAVLGDLFRPKSFAGLFDAAPSVALATLTLAAVKDGAVFAGEEARAMLAGALALAAYCHLTGWSLMRQKGSSLTIAIAALPLWFAIAFGLGALIR
jgi:hypothetical protein